MVYGVLKSLFLVVFVGLAACTTEDIMPMVNMEAAAATDTYTLGDRQIRIVTTRYGTGRYTLVALHENESTSVAAAKEVLRRYGGTLVELRHGGTRNVSFTLEGKRYSFDPNRIFTEAGIRKSLQGGNDPIAADMVKGLANAIVRKLSGQAIIALHNNTNGGYSILSYRNGGQYARDAAGVYVNPSHDPDDFFFVTHGGLFSRIKAAGYNAALQSGQVTDDGSLSVYAARGGHAYVNVEAENGHRDIQIKMLDALLAP